MTLTAWRPGVMPNADGSRSQYHPWRCANKRKRSKERARVVEAYLGDTVGMPLAPMRSYRQNYQPADWVRNLTHRTTAAVGVIFYSLLGLGVLVSAFMAAKPAIGRDLDGRYAQSELKTWFDQLRSKKGNCCSQADGLIISDVDWDTQDGHYRVRLQGQWIVIPDDAVITEPNRYGPAVVWPVIIDSKITLIRCFMPGTMS